MSNSRTASIGRIFINYRRDDTAYPAGWLYDRLATRYGSEQVFKDVDAIDLGDDFVTVLTEAVGACEVLLALIGPQWLNITDSNGKRRLEDPDDFVRVEIEAALAREVALIPVLVDGAELPPADELPSSLTALLQRESLELRSDHFGADADVLVGQVDPIVKPKKRLAPMLTAVGTVLTCLAVALVLTLTPGEKKPPEKFKCWNGDTVAAGAKCPPLTGRAAFNWAYKWDTSEFQTPRCDRIEPTEDNVIDQYQCKWDDLRGTRSQVQLQRWPSVKYAKSSIEKLIPGSPANRFVEPTTSGPRQDVGWSWNGTYDDFEGSGEHAAATFFLYKRVPLVLIAIGHDKNFDQAIKNCLALTERFQVRKDAELAAVVKSIE